MSVIANFINSDNFIILIKYTYHIIACTSRPLELYADGAASYAYLCEKDNGDVISKGVQTMEAELYFFMKRVERFVTLIPFHLHLSHKHNNYVYCCAVFCDPPQHTQHPPDTSSNYIQPKPYRICNLTVVLCSPYHRKVMELQDFSLYCILLRIMD